ncbi:MAG: alpha-galactosidase [Clostridia bacterium]|nr:alpha-galactosidase [Clostridia bacterium]
MDFSDREMIDFNYDGIPLGSLDFERSVRKNPEGEVIFRRFKDGLSVTTQIRQFDEFGAVEWRNTVENTSDKASGIISDLWDCAVYLPLPHDDDRKFTAYIPREKDCAIIYSPNGSEWSDKEFYDDPFTTCADHSAGMLFPGWKKRYTPAGGRSSQGKAPFFNIHKGDTGYVIAVGWSGQWAFECERANDFINIKSGIDNLSFSVYGGEKLNLSSVVIMPYSGSFIDGQNKWRRFVRKHFSLIGTPGRSVHGPLCAGIWGGMPTKDVLERLDVIDKHALPFEYIWMDAGWYGDGTSPSPDEFEGDWGQHTGDWQVNTNYHPDSLMEVSRKIHGSGRGFLLWFEPERVIDGTPVTKAHPEYFLRKDGSKNLLLDLGNDNAWNYCFETISGIIDRLKIDFYRHDFNMEPLAYWDLNDAPDRKGISQIRHVNGLYRLWDRLLERFPHLMIDNCASGGRRIDIRMLRRSVPLWRSDAMCPADFKPETAQCHSLTFPVWLPYSGTGAGRAYDTYRARSCYSSCLTVNYAFSQRDAFGDNPAKLDWIKHMCGEFLRVRPYLEGDFYPLTEFSACDDAWTVLQYDCPEKHEGVILAFRREKSGFDRGLFTLGGCKGAAKIVFTDADTQETFSVQSREIKIELPEKRSSKLLFYRYS